MKVLHKTQKAVELLKLSKYRLKIDRIDAKISMLLDQRFEQVLQIAQLSTKTVDLQREAQIIKRVATIISPKFKHANQIIFKTILIQSRKLKIAAKKTKN